MAPRQSAEAEGLAEGPQRGQPLGPDAARRNDEALTISAAAIWVTPERPRRRQNNTREEIMIGKISAAAALLAVLTGPALAQQHVSVTIAAGQPPAALPSLALVGKYFIPEVDKRIKDAKIDVVIDWKEAYAGSLLKP